MQRFISQILRFEKKGDKTGWTYIEIPQDVAMKLSPGNRKSFRVKGMLDNHPINGVALLPMGEGSFILPLNANIRKGIRKAEGAMLDVFIELDNEYKLVLPAELQEYLEEDGLAADYFESLAKSHRDYFVKWIEGAKTQITREKRLVETAKALSARMTYGEMIRGQKKKKE
ncbi:YdeI/OmpD-associated family protein [Desertivirga arenae]|uniref:YdeI/OmpD-associated family protein n=1 Tax=Desertivirga arenae TaxID=2810309 RepID=UPI001A9632BE|nr:YdeI/OmpD-associated family protein [Pedobacter sp. SYSU D00823]